MDTSGNAGVRRAIAILTPIHEHDEPSDEARVLSGGIATEGWADDLERAVEVVTGFANLATLLLLRLERATGKDSAEILREIAVRVAED